ncbi:FAD binding domain-containing protein [Bacillus infantis]|uniref:FAD binding domain-containing protein n=1 Tax=Bacillus infantis TaxID=324767 RepID=UPI003CED605C
MKPAKFDYHSPNNLTDALNLIEEAGFDGKIIAGGQSLVPIMNMRLAAPECLIDINGLNELDFIEGEGDMLKIGAMTRQSRVETSSLVKEKCGLLSEAIPFIGHVQTRNRGTFGGSIVHADPSAEIPLSLIALGGSLKIASIDDTREVNAEDFFITYLTTDIMPAEILTEIHIPSIAERSGYAFTEVARRHGDFALVAAACQLTLDDMDKVTSARLALGGVEAVPLLIKDLDEILIGEKLTDALLKKVTEVVEECVEPESDLHASAAYRYQLAKVLASRALKQAYQRARG